MPKYECKKDHFDLTQLVIDEIEDGEGEYEVYVDRPETDDEEIVRVYITCPNCGTENYFRFRPTG